MSDKVQGGSMDPQYPPHEGAAGQGEHAITGEDHFFVQPPNGDGHSIPQRYARMVKRKATELRKNAREKISFSAAIAILSLVTSLYAALVAHGATRLERRAWVGVAGVTPKPITIGERLELQVVFQNFGTSPARKLAISNSIDWQNPQASPEQLIEAGRTNAKRLGWVSLGVLMPSVAGPSTAKSAISITPEIFEGIMSHKLKLRVFGEVIYEDIFKQRRTTTYCFVYDPGREAYIMSESGNEAE